MLFGRGFAISAHPGNQTLRILVRAHKPTFLQKRKAQKRDVARQIVDDFIHKLGGRFLIEDPNNKDNSSKRNNKEGIYEKAWVGVETEKAVDKGTVISNSSTPSELANYVYAYIISYCVHLLNILLICVQYRSHAQTQRERQPASS